MIMEDLFVLILVALASAKAPVEFAFPVPEAYGIEDGRGFPGVDARALQRRNRKRLLSLQKMTAAHDICSDAVPFPRLVQNTAGAARRSRRPLDLFHAPKAGTPFLATVLRYGCENGDADSLPAFGDRPSVEFDARFARRASPEVPGGNRIPTGPHPEVRARGDAPPLRQLVPAPGQDLARGLQSDV